MTETEFITWAGKVGWSGVALLFTYSGYLGVKAMIPEWVARYRARTSRLTAQDAQRGLDLVQKLKINGAEMRVIEDSLAGSARFRQQLVGEILERATLVAERVRVLETKMEDVKADIQAIRAGQSTLRDLLEQKADALRDQIEVSRDKILLMLERRKEPR